MEDLFARLSGGHIFSNLDLSQAYQQIRLDEALKELVTINTQKGLSRYTRLPLAPGIFRVMEEVLQGIPNVVVYLDDNLGARPSEEEHGKLLDDILGRLQALGYAFVSPKAFLGLPQSPI